MAAVLLGASPASAHASLVTCSPVAGSVVDEQPKTVSLTFSEPVEVTRDSIQVNGPDGEPVPGITAGLDPEDRATVVAALPGQLAAGTYRVSYRVLSIDGHPVQGEIRWAYKSATASLVTPPGDAEPTGPSARSVAPRALAAGGALALAGLVAYALVVVAAARRTLPERVGSKLQRESLVRLRVPVVVALACGVAGAAMTAVDTVDQTTGSVRPGALASFLTSSRTGDLLSARMFLLLAASALVLRGTRQGSGRSGRPDPWMVGGLLAATGAVVTLALSSHEAAASADRVVAIVFASLHLSAVGVWAGGLLGLALGGVPAARATGGGNQQVVGDAVAALARSFSATALFAMLVVLTTGGYLALVQITSLRQLADTSWGEALTIKVALWVTLLMFAGVNAVALVPKLADRAGRAKERQATSGKLSSAMQLELLVAVVLIAVASVMAASPPPASVAGSSAFADSTANVAADRKSSSATSSGQGYDVRVLTTRVGDGRDAATVFRVLLSTEGAAASAPEADALLSGSDGVDRSMSLQLVGAGEWLSDRLSVGSGRYRFTARFLRSGQRVALPVTVRVP